MNGNAGAGLSWISLALVNAGLAQTKGRSRWYWFLFSLFLGPLATLLIVVWAPRGPEGSDTAPATGR
jgi:bacteriorhodopsin